MRTGAEVINAASQIHNSLTVSANQRMTKWSRDISEKHHAKPYRLGCNLYLQFKSANPC